MLGYSIFKLLSAPYIKYVLTFVEYIVLSFPSTIPHWSNNAQTPLVKAVAAELPDNVDFFPPTDVVLIFIPGVVISGLTRLLLLNPLPESDIKVSFILL